MNSFDKSNNLKKQMFDSDKSHNKCPSISSCLCIVNNFNMRNKKCNQLDNSYIVLSLLFNYRRYKWTLDMIKDIGQYDLEKEVQCTINNKFYLYILSKEERKSSIFIMSNFDFELLLLNMQFLDIFRHIFLKLLLI